MTKKTTPKKSDRKLKLRREVLRQLDADALGSVQGGILPQCTYSVRPPPGGFEP